MQLLAFILMLFGALCVGMGAIAWLPFIEEDMRVDLVGVVVFVVGGSLFFLAGSWLQRRVPLPQPRTFTLKPGDTSFIAAMILRDRRIYLRLGLFLLAFDALLLFLLPPLEEAEAELAHPLIPVLITIAGMILFAAVGVLFVYHSIKLRSGPSTRLYEILTKTPQKVTSLTVYFFQHELAPGTIGRQILAEIEAEHEKLRTGATEEQCSLLKQYIQLHSPHAAYREVEQEVSHSY